MNLNQFSLLHGEDDIHDIEMFKRVLTSMKYEGQYQSLSIGQDVVDWVLKKGRFARSLHNMPDLIVLDIGLPGLNGKEILKLLRENESSRHIPIIIMSGSVSERDFHECIALGCNGYIKKDASLRSLSETCRLLVKSWMKLSTQTFV